MSTWSPNYYYNIRIGMLDIIIVIHADDNASHRPVVPDCDGSASSTSSSEEREKSNLPHPEIRNI